MALRNINHLSEERNPHSYYFSDNGLFLDLIIPHYECALIGLKKKFGDNIIFVDFIKDSITKDKKHGVMIYFKPEIMNLVENELHKLKDIDILDCFINKIMNQEFFNIMVMLEDSALNCLMNKNNNGNKICLWYYKLLSSYSLFNGAVEYFKFSIPNEKVFFDIKLNLEEEAINHRFDWRLYKGANKLIIPGFSLTEQYILDQSLETDYFKNYDKNELKPLAEKMNMNLSKICKETERLAGDTYLKFKTELEQSYKK